MSSSVRELAVAQQTVLESLSLDTEGWRWCERALEALGPNPPPVLEAPLKLALANYCLRDAYFERSVEAALRSAALYQTVTRTSTRRNLSARACRATALAVAGLALATLNRFDEAACTASESVALARQESDTMVLIWALQSTRSVGDIAERRKGLEEALALSRTFPSGYAFEGTTLMSLSYAEYFANALDRARWYAAEAADSFKQTVLHPSLVCWALCIGAIFASLAGDLDGALVTARDALSRFGGGGRFFLLDAVQVVAAELVRHGGQREAALLIGGCEAAADERFSKPPAFAKALIDRTMAQLREQTPSGELEAWLAEGRNRSYEQTIAAALDIEHQIWPFASRLFG